MLEFDQACFMGYFLMENKMAEKWRNNLQLNRAEFRNLVKPAKLASFV